jgi:hypothetical protein
MRIRAIRIRKDDRSAPAVGVRVDSSSQTDGLGLYVPTDWRIKVLEPVCMEPRLPVEELDRELEVEDE